MSAVHRSADRPEASADPVPRIAVVGAPNSGKSSIFNRLTGLHAKTGNYPGVTVARFVGHTESGGHRITVEDLPGTYSLAPISPDEQVAVDVLNGGIDEAGPPDALLVVVDATTLRRSILFVGQVLGLGLPVCVVVTFTDELARRQGTLDVAAFAEALGVPALPVIGHRGLGVPQVRDLLAHWRDWPTPVVAPPGEPAEREAWAESVLAYAGYRSPQRHKVTQRIDAVLLHPVAGTVVFFAVMMAFFQVIFALAPPLQDLVKALFDWLADLVDTHVHIPWLAGLLGQALIGGVGAVLVFVPQIMLLFLLLAVLEGVGYLARAAFLMDRVMGRFGLEGRAFVALLSSVACAIPGIMATRTLPSAKDRLATMMAAPLMTCSARLPVYVLLIGMLVSSSAKVGPFGAQGLTMFGLYLLGAVSAMLAAWTFKRLGDRKGAPFPFFMELPPYRLPAPRAVVTAVLSSAHAFLRKCSTIIVATSIVLWLLLNLPMHSDAQMRAAGVDVSDDTAVSSYTIDHSYAADVGRLISPVFDPLGFDWRINVGIVSAQAARETFVATLGQVASAEDPEHPEQALSAMTHTSGPHAGEPVFTAPTIAALLVYFTYALQCMSTMAVLRRETGTWRWPVVAVGYLTVLAWLMAFLARTVTSAWVG